MTNERPEEPRETGEPEAVPDVARLAHELRTPLSAIATLAEIMRDERLGPLGTARYKGYAADIHQSAAHANSVLSGWVETSRAGGVPVALDFVEIDPGALVAAAISALGPLAATSGVTLQVAAFPPLPHVIADRRCIVQILNNLVANALKFTPPGGTVTVGLAYTPRGPLVLEVADDGDGMTPAELARAQSSAASPEPLRRRAGGSGIGLPLVRTLAAACGATFEIDSALGQGTRARLLLPHDRVIPV